MVAPPGSDPWQDRLHADAATLLAGWTPPDEEQARARDAYLVFLAEHPDAADRACTAGHLTASTLIIDDDRERVLLTLHPKVGRWLQVGGHLERDDTGVADAAGREAREESGIPDLALLPGPLRLDRHRGHCRRDLPPADWPFHLDVQFLAIAPAGARPVRSAESTDLRWFAWADLPRLPDADAAVLALAAAARHAVAG